MLNKQIKTISYLNQETGEYNEKKTYVDMQFNDDGYLFWKNKNSIKSFFDVSLPSELSWSERGKVEEIRHYILKENQMLVYRSNKGINPLTVKEIARITQTGERQATNFINKLKACKVIKEVSIAGVNYYCFNPIYGLKDKRINLTIFIIFQDELKEVLPKWVLTKFLDQVKDINPNIKVIK